MVLFLTGEILGSLVKMYDRIVHEKLQTSSFEELFSLIKSPLQEHIKELPYTVGRLCSDFSAINLRVDNS